MTTGVNHTFLRALFNGLKPILRVKPGIGEIKLLVDVLGQGHGMNSREELRRVCALLMVKDIEDLPLFEEEFQRQYQAFAGELGYVIRKEIGSESKPDEPVKAPESPDLPKPEKEALPDMPPPPEKEAVLDYFVEQTIVDGGSDLLNAEDKSSTFFEYPYLFSDEFLPMTLRQMENQWRFLQRNIRRGVFSEEMDIPATVSMFAKHLAVDEPQWRRLKINKTQLLLLIDRGGSMIAHHTLGENLVLTALRTKWDNIVVPYYFRNLPVGDLSGNAPLPNDLRFFDTPAMIHTVPLDKIRRLFQLSETRVVIFSDAGAARGGLNQDRIVQTKAWLKVLRQKVNGVVWLNPMPENRWFGTSAEWIRDAVPMFEVDRKGFHKAIKYLQGA